MHWVCVFLSGSWFAVAPEVTLRWQHSVEKIQWEETYRAEQGKLAVIRARVQGSGAGMEVPDGAVWQNGAWEYRPALPPQAQIEWRHSPWVQDVQLCVDQRCQPLHRWQKPSAEAVWRFMACD